jgi:hypothetical protein
VFTVFALQSGFLMIVSLVLFAAQAWAFVDAVSRPAQAFVAADKMTKQAWMIILGVALAAHLLLWNPFSILNLAGAVAAIVYLVDARPAMRGLTRR